jgi:subtilisin family serine protease/PKD repeat protein
MKNLKLKKLILSIAIAISAGVFLSSNIGFSDDNFAINLPRIRPSHEQLHEFNSQLLEEEVSKKQPYVPDKIIVKFKKEAADILEREMVTKRRAHSAVRLAASLEKLNRKHRVKRITQVFKGFRRERERLERLRSKERIKRKYQQSEYIRNQVRFTDKDEKILKRLRRGNLEKDIPDLDRIYILELEEGQSVEEAVRDYSKDPNVVFAHPSYIMKFYAPVAPPEIKSFTYNISYDFLEDLILDDAEIVWKAVPEAVEYKVMIDYSGDSYDQEFIIPNGEIIDLGGGDLKYIWVDYLDNPPPPHMCPFPREFINMTSIDVYGAESAPLDFSVGLPSKAAVYGKITDSITGDPIEGARIHVTQRDPHSGRDRDYGDYYSDADGMYYVVGLGWRAASSGAHPITRLDLYKEEYDDRLENYVTLDHDGQIEKLDIALSPSVPNPPVIKSFTYNISYDFLEDLILDDAEIVWEAVPEAAEYKVVIYYGYDHIPDGEFVIANEDIIVLANGDLQYIWVDYETTHPNPTPYPTYVRMKSIDAGGLESKLSDGNRLSPKTLIYGRITDADYGYPIEGARINAKQWFSPPGTFSDCGDYYSDADGMYYIVGLRYMDVLDGFFGDTRLDVYKGNKYNLDNQVILEYDGQIERIDIELVPIPPDPPVLKSFTYNISHDFLQDLELDDAEIVWGEVPEAAEYKVVIYYGYDYIPDGEFVIANEDIVVLANGDLQYIWVDYETTHQNPTPYPTYVMMKSIDAGGVESKLSDGKRLPPKTLIYGQITDAGYEYPIEDARIHVKQLDSQTGEFIDYGNYYSDADGMYYIVGLRYMDVLDGFLGDTRLDVYKGRYEDNLDNQVILEYDGQITELDIPLTELPLDELIDLPYVPNDYYIEDPDMYDPYTGRRFWREGSWEQTYPDLWGLRNIKAIEAWNLFDKDGSGAIDGEEKHPGEGVIVAVVDTGVDYNHPDLIDNMWQNEDEFEGDANDDGFPGVGGVDDDEDGLIDEDSRGNSRFLEDDVTPNPDWQNDVPADDDENGVEDDFIGYDFSGDEDEPGTHPDDDPMDYIGHGTHCAGTIAAMGDNEIGITGVAYKAKIMPVKIFPQAYDYVGARAIKYAANSGADILSNSWGPSWPIKSNPTIEAAIDYAHDIWGCVIVFAAGNSYDDVSRYAMANYPKTIAVAAVGYSEQKADFSNWGEKIDVAAPGGSGNELPIPKELWTHVETAAEDLGNGASLAKWYLLNTVQRWILISVYENKTEDATVEEHRSGIHKTLGNLRGSDPSMDSVIEFIRISYQWGYEFQKGNSVLSTMPDESEIAVSRPKLRLSDDHYRLRGTSMACPHVAGLAAVIKSMYPSITHDEIYSRIVSGAEAIDSYNPEFEGLLGSGRINVYNSLTVEPRPLLKLVDVEYNGIEAGVTTDIVIYLKNFWQGVADAEATLSCDSPFVEIPNPTVFLGDMDTGDIKSNTENPFIITISPECPYGTSMNFTLTVNYNGGNGDEETFYFDVLISFFKDVGAEAVLPLSDFFPHVVGLEDYNNDDYTDAWCIGFGAEGLYRNNKDGSFTRVDKGDEDIGIEVFDYTTWEVFFIDIDNDGDKDLFQARRSGDNNLLFLNNGDGTFSDISDSSGISSTAAHNSIAFDYNNDGFVDILCTRVIHYKEDISPYILQNNGDNTFTKISKETGLPENINMLSGTLASFDYDNDGDQDLLISSVYSTNRLGLFRNNGDGTFTDIIEGSGIVSSYAADGVAAGDYNNDGHIDLFLTGFYSRVPLDSYSTLYKNNGNGTFSDVNEKSEGLWEWVWGWRGTDFLDYDNDGDLDLHVTDTGYDYGNKFYRNDGDDVFTDVTNKAFPENINPTFASAGIGDYNYDGALDVYAPAGIFSEGLGTLLENRVGLENNSIRIKLEDLTANRFAYGARVYVYTEEESVKQTREVHTGAVEATPLHFGLGQAEVIDKIEVLWPVSGQTQTLEDVELKDYPEGIITITADPYVYLQSITPNSAPLGETVTLKGKNFGSAQGSGYVEFPDGPHAQIESWSDTQIICTVPQTATSGNLFVITDQMERSNGIYFTVERLGYKAHRIIDDWSGGSFRVNGDGQFNPDERIELQIEIISEGYITAEGVHAELSCQDTYITIFDEYRHVVFPDISSGSSAWSEDYFLIEAKEDTPDNHTVTFTLDIEDSEGDSWQDTFDITIVPAVPDPDAPILNPIDDQTVEESRELRFHVQAYNSQATEMELFYDTQGLSQEQRDNLATATFKTIFFGPKGLNDGLFKWTPPLGTEGEHYPLIFIARDELGRCAYQPITITVLPGPEVHYQAHKVIDDWSGGSFRVNGDGQFNPGERVELQPELIHQEGAQTVVGISATLSCQDTYVTILDNDVVFPNIPLGVSAWSADYFLIEAKDNTPDNRTVTFTLDIRDSEGHSWQDTFDITIMPAVPDPDALVLQHIGDQQIEEFQLLEFDVIAKNSTGTESMLLCFYDTLDPALINDLRAASFVTHFDPATGETTGTFSWLAPALKADGKYDPVIFVAIDNESGRSVYQPMAITVLPRQSNILAVDHYNDGDEDTNDLGLWTGWEQNTGGDSNVEEVYLHRFDGGSKTNKAKKFTYDCPAPGDYLSYTSNLWDEVTLLDISDFDYLSFRVKGEKGGEDFYVELQLGGSPLEEWILINDYYIDADYNSTPAFCDIDADGDYDMFIGGDEGRISFYRNDGTAQEPDWTLVTSSYNGIDVGALSTPDFCDIDGDGDYDMFIGRYDGKIGFYRNDGTPESSDWTLVSETYNDINVDYLAPASPTFCDIDGDGDYDMFIGQYGGNIVFFQNDGTPQNPVWTLVNDSYNDINVGVWNMPTFCDIDADGDYDMFIGEIEGSIFFYRNDGTSKSASWTLISSSYNGIDVGMHSSPSFCDIDADGNYDMFIGNGDTNVAFYRNNIYERIKYTAEILSSDYFTVTDEWQQVNIPLTAFEDLDKSIMRAVAIIFSGDLSVTKGIVEIDNLEFSKGYGKLQSTGPVKIDRETKKLLVESEQVGIYEEFKIKGVDYQPVPIRHGPPNPDDPNIYDRDFRLLVDMGCNTIRTWEMPGINIMAKAEEYGLKVVAGFQMDCTSNYRNPAVREEITRRFAEFIEAYKDSPALLMWVIGDGRSPYHRGLLYALPDEYYYSFANELAQIAYEELEGDVYHPVILTNSHLFNIGVKEKEAEDMQLNYIDGWGCSAYVENFSEIDWYGDKDDFFELYKEKSTKPLIITEYGTDAFYTTNYYYYYPPMTHKGILMVEGAVNEHIQAERVRRNTIEIMNASDICLGGCVMEYSDEWWRDHNLTHSYNSWSQDKGGFDIENRWHISSPDDYANEEYWGIVRIAPDGEWPDEPWNEPGDNVDDIATRLVYDSLKELFTNPVLEPGLHYKGYFMTDIWYRDLRGFMLNGDWKFNPGERIEVGVIVENINLPEVSDVTATLSTADANITIWDNEAYFGAISRWQAVQSRDTFLIEASKNTPDNHTVTFVLVMRDGQGNEWNDEFEMTIVPAEKSPNEPIIEDIEDQVVLEGGELEFEVTAYNPMGGSLMDFFYTYDPFVLGKEKGKFISEATFTIAIDPVTGQQTGAFRWTPGPGTAGEYPIVFVAMNDSSRSVFKPMNITVYSPPIADFEATPTEGEGSLTVNFTDQSTGYITDWIWDFGDGTQPSNEQNPTHAYQNPGIYTVVLVVTGFGGSDIKTKKHYIKVHSVVSDNEGLFEAIDESYPGHTIILEPGIYRLSSNLAIEKSITLLGRDPMRTVIELGEYHILVKKPLVPPDHPNIPPYLRDFTKVTMKGLTITGYRGTSENGPIQNYADRLDLRNCRVLDNEGRKVSAIYNHSKSVLVLWNTLIAKNRNFSADRLSAYGPYGEERYYTGYGYYVRYRVFSGAIFLDSGAVFYMENSTIADNINNSQPFTVVQSGYGYETGYGQPEESEVIVTYGAIHQDYENNLNITSSIMWGNGPSADGSQDIAYRGPIDDQDQNIIYSCIQQLYIPGPTNSPYILHEDPRFICPKVDDYNIDEDSPCIGTGKDGTDMGAYFEQETIRVPRDCSTIIEALASASPDAAIVISPDMYYPSSNLNITKNTILLGLDPLNTIIDLGYSRILIEDAPANTPHVFRTTDSTIEGLTIERYRGRSQNGPIENHANKLTLKDCRIIGNDGVRASAIYTKPSSELHLENVLIAKNTNMPMDIILPPDDPWGTPPQQNYYRGTIYLDEGANLYMEKSTIADNFSDGVYIAGGDNWPVPPSTYGAIQRDANNYLNIINSIMWGNSDSEDISYIDMDGQERDIAYSDIQQDKVAGDGIFEKVISKDPLFIDRIIYDNYNIGTNSPCRFAGEDGTAIGAYFEAEPLLPPLPPY